MTDSIAQLLDESPVERARLRAHWQASIAAYRSEIATRERYIANIHKSLAVLDEADSIVRADLSLDSITRPTAGDALALRGEVAS